jgi:hypothetical protein
MVGKRLLLLRGPFIMPYAIVEVVVVAFATLLAISALDVEVGLHDAGDLGPTRHVLVFVEVLEDAVLLHRQTCTT